MTTFANEFLLQEFFHKCDEGFSDFPPDRANTLSLDLGCGPTPQNPFRATTCKGIDIIQHKDIVICNLFADDIPYDDNTADYITAFDFIEHVPRLLTHGDKVRFRFVELMSEVFRVLKPGGFFFSHTPAYPSPAAFQDPTHVNIITDATYPKYFCNRGTKRPGASRYGFNGGFILIAQKMYSSHLLTLMRKP